jgi:amino acid transporter
MQMKKNMGTIDRVIRVLLAILVGILYLTGNISGIAAIILGIFAIAFIVTSLIGFCPLYVPLHISTIGKK